MASASEMAGPFRLMFAVGGALTLAHLVLPQSGRSHDALLLAAACACFALAVLVSTAGRRVPAWTYQIFNTAAAALTALIVYASGDSTSAYSTFFFWIGISSFYFFDDAEAAEQGVVLAIAVALAIAAEPGRTDAVPVVNWIFMTCVLAAAGALNGRLGRQHTTRLEDQVTQAARTDQQTGLFNRRGFEEALRAEAERAQRTNRSFSVLVADVDGFRRINDSFGPHAGDLAFEYIGAIMRRAKRRIDVAARIGEDEFAILLPETGEHAAYIVAERIRHELKVSFESEPVPLTISIGVANWPVHRGTARSLLAAGEQALLLAKELGGDRSAMYGDNILTRLATASARKDEDKHLVTLMSLAEAVDIRDGGTAAHCQNVGRYAAALARELGLSQEMVERVRCAGVLHDLGKIGVPDAVLQKPGPLNDAEWLEMRKHPEIGAHILEGKDLTDVRQWILEHHERPDGRGYPYGLGAQQVPLEAKIIAVADAFEAMTADRVYRRGIPAAEACDRLRGGAGKQWDSDVVEAMIRLVERRDLLVATSLSIAGPAGEYAETTYGQGGRRRGQSPATEAPPERSGAETIGRPQGSIVVRGRLAGRHVETVWSTGRVSGDPLVVTMVEQLVLTHQLDLSDPVNFLLLMGSAVDQGTLDADGDVPQLDVLETV
jgi:diguanylate cyclase (GGDEF)-like protein/putative nucleotidyltransferase with HDIG domain